METIRMTWGNPGLEVQQFIPQEYCELCFYYEAELLCNIARQGGPGTQHNDSSGMAHQYDSCGTSYVTVTFENGSVSYEGYESYNYSDGIHDGAKVDLHDVAIPGIYDIDPTSGPLPTIQGATWQSTFRNQTWYHNGPAVIKEWYMTKEGHPNHS